MGQDKPPSLRKGKFQGRFFLELNEQGVKSRAALVGQPDFNKFTLGIAYVHRVRKHFNQHGASQRRNNFKQDTLPRVRPLLASHAGAIFSSRKASNDSSLAGLVDGVVRPQAPKPSQWSGRSEAYKQAGSQGCFPSRPHNGGADRRKDRCFPYSQ